MGRSEDAGVGDISIEICELFLYLDFYRVSAEPSLPRGWEINFTKSGRRYFIDHNTKTTSFTDPR